jgi:hypothetical protein
MFRGRNTGKDMGLTVDRAGVMPDVLGILDRLLKYDKKEVQSVRHQFSGQGRRSEDYPHVRHHLTCFLAAIFLGHLNMERNFLRQNRLCDVSHTARSFISDYPSNGGNRHKTDTIHGGEQILAGRLHRYALQGYVYAEILWQFFGKLW